jgi:hypothetical protein
MFIITGGLHLWAADLRRHNRRPARRDGIADSPGDRPSMSDAVRIGAGSLSLYGGWPTPSPLPPMSVPLFLAGRDLLEFSRDRGQHQRARRTVYKDPLGCDPARPGQLAEEPVGQPGRLAGGRTRWPPSRRPPRSTGNWPPGGPMPTTSWNNRCDLLTGSSTAKATHPRGNLRRDNGPLSRPPEPAMYGWRARREAVADASH